jgi:putative transposase
MKSSKKNVLRRAHKVFLNDLNAVKAQKLKTFLYLCRDVQQYFIDMYWQRQDMSGSFAPLADVHLAVKRFNITTRLGQALAKQALEAVASQRKKSAKERTRPKLQSHSVALFYHFVTIEDFEGEGFDIALRFVGSGAPRLVAPVKSTAPIDKLLASGWERGRTIRLGIRRGRIWVEFFFERAKPALKVTGSVVGMDSNYKNGLVFSDGQQIGKRLYDKIRSFSKRQKNTHREIKDELGRELKKLDLSKIKVLAISCSFLCPKT